MRSGQEQSFWRDKEKRRALFLSLFLHLAGLSAVIYAYVAPTPLEPENFIVLDLGTPEQAETRDAAAAAEPAPQAAEPDVASEAAGAPRTPSVAPRATEPEAAPEAAQPEADAAPSPPQAQAPARPPAPQANVPAPSAESLDLPPQDAAAALPEVDEVELEPQPLAEAIQIPQPSAAASVPEAREIRTTPRVQVAPRTAVPEPSAQVSVSAAQAVPVPEASASVTERDIPAPQAQASVASARAVPSPQAQVSVPSARPLETTPGVQVSEATPVPSPQATATATVPDTPDQPDPDQVAAEAQAAAETAETTTDVAPAEDTQSGVPAANSEADAAGGNAADTGETQVQDEALADNAGAAAAPDASAPATGAPEDLTYEMSRSQPIAVMLDNALGYPQTGLREASAVFEMPVEGGATRLMSVYDNPNSTPSEVGPIRSAREYFVQAASALNGTLVHVGGSPGALNEIARGQPTLDALEQTEQSGPFFAASNQIAPYSTYASGSALRQAVARLELNASRVLSGTAYRPAEDATGAGAVSVSYSGDYSSGFRYISQLAQYRWLRDGSDASDASGEAVLVDAVVVADIIAQPLPGDPEGRLYIPYRGGNATLYLRGKAISGTWDTQGGFTFLAEDGNTIDLAPYKHWILFAPEYADVSAE